MIILHPSTELKYFTGQPSGHWDNSIDSFAELGFEGKVDPLLLLFVAFRHLRLEKNDDKVPMTVCNSSFSSTDSACA